MRDKYNRKINYVRISVTDRCNLNCFYCMPLNGKFKFIAHQNIMRYEDITQLMSSLVKLGISNVRITGGEPLVRKNIDELINMLSTTTGVRDISLTTNGILLPQMAVSLKKAGLKRVNISLDTLLEHKFKKRISPTHSPQQVLTGIEKALETGLSPVKINVIPIRGFNDDEIIDFVNLTKTLDINIRFIELMPVSEESKSLQSVGFMSNLDVKNIIESAFGNLKETIDIKGFGPAKNYKIDNFKGSIGFISHISRVFCSSCNRIRITSDGFMKRCLYEHPGINIKEHLTDISFLSDLIFNKPRDFTKVIKSSRHQKMYNIGG